MELERYRHPSLLVLQELCHPWSAVRGDRGGPVGFEATRSGFGYHPSMNHLRTSHLNVFIKSIHLGLPTSPSSNCPPIDSPVLAAARERHRPIYIIPSFRFQKRYDLRGSSVAYWKPRWLLCVHPPSVRRQNLE